MSKEAEKIYSDIQDAQDRLAILKHLTLTQGWVEFETFMKQQVSLRRRQIESVPAHTADDVIRMTHTQAEITGLRFASEYVGELQDTLEDEIGALQEYVKTLTEKEVKDE